MEVDELVKEAKEEIGELSPFDRRVAMTIAIIAAILALVSMLSHRAHTETLSLQAEANRLTTEANINHTLASDEWAYYQAKNIRNTQYQGLLALVTLLPSAPAARQIKSRMEQDWKAAVEKYEQRELPDLKAKAEALVNKARQLEGQSARTIAESYHAHHRGDRYDLAELGIELALVVCSLAVLTKSSWFWYLGMLVCGLGAATAVSAAMMS